MTEIEILAFGFVAAALVAILLASWYAASQLSRIRSLLTPTSQPAGATPSHVVFGETIIGIPPLPGMLDRPLWMKNPTPGFAGLRSGGTWVNRGDAIAAFVIKRRILRNDVYAEIRSPISGRLLYTTDTNMFGGLPEDHQPAWLRFIAMIEVPRGEYIPGTLRESFGQFCDVLWEHRDSVLRKPRDGSFPGYDDDQIKQALDTMRESIPVCFQKNVEYQERIDWLNLHYPHGIGSMVNLTNTVSGTP